MRYNHFDMLPERAFLKVGGRITLEGGGGGGQTTGTTYQTNIPEWLRAPTERMVARGETLSEQPYQPYTGERVAGFSPAQQAAFQQVYGLQTPGEFGAAAQGVSTGYGAAAGAAGLGNQYAGDAAARAGSFGVGDFTAANRGVNLAYGDAANAAARAGSFGVGDFNAANQGVGMSQQAAVLGALRANQYDSGQFGTAEAQQYMSPYQQAVTDIAKREAAVEAQQANRMLAANAAKAGAFGGSRFGLEQAQVYRSGLQNLSDIQTKGSQAAFENAQAQFERDRAARLAGENLALQGTGMAAQYGLAGAQTLAQQQQAREAQRMQAEQLAASTSQEQARLAMQGAQTLAQQEQAREAQRMQAEQLALQGNQLAANTALQGGQMQSAAALQGAGLLSNLGTARQAADLQRIQALSTVGGQQQALAQQQLDAEYQQAMEQRDWEKNQLGFLSGLVRGAPFSTTQLQTSPGASTTSQIASLGLGAYGLANLLGSGKKDGGVIKMAKGGSVSGYAQGGSVDMYPDEVLEAVVAGKSDAVLPMEAERELRRRRMLRTAVEGTEADKTLMDGKSLADKAEEGGIANLPAENMGEFADGGIIGYSGEDGSLVEEETYGDALKRFLRRQFMPGTALSEEDKASARKAVFNPLNVAEGKSFLETPIRRAPVAAPTATPAAKKDEAPAAAPAAGPARAPKTPGVNVTPTAGKDVAGQPFGASYIDKINQIMEGRNKEIGAAKEEFTGEQSRLDKMRSDIKGIAALRAAAAIAQGGPGGTWGQVGRGLGAFGEEAMRGENLMQSASQGLMGQKLQLAQLQRAADAGDITALTQLEQLKQQGPLYAAQAKYYGARAADTGTGGAGAGLANLKALQANLQAQLKGFQGKVDPQSKAQAALIQQKLSQVESAIANRAGLDLTSGFVSGTPGKTTTHRSSLFEE